MSTSPHLQPPLPRRQNRDSSDDDHLSPRAMPLASKPSPNPSLLDLTSAKPTKRPSRVNFSADHSSSRNASPAASHRSVSGRATILKRSASRSNTDTGEVEAEGTEVGRTGADDGIVVDERTAMLGVEDGRTYNTEELPARRTVGGQRLKKRKSAPSSLDEQDDAHDTEDNAAANTASALVGWWKKFLDRYGSVELENKGSVARDHLALERTFLAWLRTSLSFASIGIAITQLFRLNISINAGDNQPTESQLRLRHIGRPLGATFLGVGIITLIIGFRRYFESQHYVIQGKFPASRGSIVLIAFCSGALIVASFAVILVIGRITTDGVAG